MQVGQIVKAGIALGIFAIIGTGLVAMTFQETHERIAENERQALLHSLHELVPPETHDNDIYTDKILVHSEKLLGTKNAVAVYRARKDDHPVAAILTPVAPDGYNGLIKLLVAIRYNGSLAGVRVLAHKETPGLGDAIDIERSDWVLNFRGRSLSNPDESGWKVKRDGGIFDQFTGATITPRAVVKAVHKCLQYFIINREKLFLTPELTANE